MVNIAIIGAGPGGLTLARILQVKGIHATIYEREPSPNVRSQGGTLDLHTETGQRALEEAGLIDQFRAHARAEGQDTLVLDKDGKVHVSKIADPNHFGRPEIDRPVLRSILLEAQHPDTIKWGHTLKSVSALENGKHTLTFDNGVTTTPDLVVGADGAWSRIRPLVSPAKPDYSGVSFIETTLKKEDASRPEIAELTGRGTMFALGNNKGIIAQKNGDGSLKVYAALRVPEAWLEESGLTNNDPAAVRPKLLDLFSDWSSEIQNLFKLGETFIPRPLFYLPVNHTWESKPGVTLLGDAAHLMSPFAGEGVNLAMADAMDLALAIAKNPTSIPTAIKEYEASLFARAQPAAEESADNLREMIAPDGLQATVYKFNHIADMIAEFRKKQEQDKH